MVAASISRGNRHPSDAEVGSQQWTTTAAAAGQTAGIPRIDRRLHRQSHGIQTRSVANDKSELSPPNITSTTQYIQLKQILEPPINSAILPNASCSQMYFRHKRFKLPWHNTRTAITTLFGRNTSYQHRHKKS